MDRTVPSSGNEEINLYLRTYYSLLRSSREVQIKTLIEAHKRMNSALHIAADEPQPDMAAFIYAILRMPACLDQLRLVVQTTNGGANWVGGDFIHTDNLILSRLWNTPASLYAAWISRNPSIGSATNLTDDPDGDDLNNLLEYAFGGDPADRFSAGHLPIHWRCSAGGGSWIEYVYAKRINADELGLSYRLERSTNLLHGIWTEGGYEVTGVGALDTEFYSVTNRIPIENTDQWFVRLRVEGF